jgi:hypothetical protein
MRKLSTGLSTSRIFAVDNRSRVLDAEGMSRLWRRRILPIGFLIALTTGLFVLKAKQDEAIIRRHFGDRTVNVLRNARSTEIIRMQTMAFGDLPFLQERMSKARQSLLKKESISYAVRYREKDQGEEFTNRLSKLLQTRRTFSKMPPDVWTPAIAFLMRSDNDAIIILVSFDQNRLRVYSPDALGKNPASAENLDFIRPQLVKLTKEAFPNDKEIQALKEQQ